MKWGMRMNKVLEGIKADFIALIKNNEGFYAAWDFGSQTHGLSDEYSDVDIVLLADGKRFNALVREAETLLGSLGSTTLCYPEGFNGEAVVNNGYLIKVNGRLFQFDIFILNSLMLSDCFCRLHYTGLRECDIIFDREGRAKELAGLDIKGSLWNEDISRLETVYWYHAYMTYKYLARGDFFKLYNAVHTMYEAHSSLLLTEYDCIPWGGSANKLSFIPADKQEHLKKYCCMPDMDVTRDNILFSMECFLGDLREAADKKAIEPSGIGREIINMIKG